MFSVSNKSKNQYAEEFKESAVKLAVESEQTITDTARDLGVNISTLNTLIKKYHQPKQSDKKVSDEHIYYRNKRLHKEVTRLKEER